jgi:hypothetical protein
VLKKNSSRISWILFFFFTVIWLVLSLKLTETHEVWIVLKHAVEGGMIGCICDWLAVRDVYKKAEENYEELVNESASMIVRQMIQIDKKPISSVIMDKLKDSNSFSAHIGHIDSFFKSQEYIHEQLVRMWRTQARDEFVKFLCIEDFSPRLKQYGIVSNYFSKSPETKVLVRSFFDNLGRDNNYLERIKRILVISFYDLKLYSLIGVDSLEDMRSLVSSFYEQNIREDLINKLIDMQFAFDGNASVLDDESIRYAVAHIISKMKDDSRFIEKMTIKFKSLKFSKYIFVNALTSFAIPSPQDILSKIEEGLREKDNSQSAIWRDIMVNVFAKYVSVWNGLDRNERERAARALVDHLSPLLTNFVAAELHETYSETKVHVLVEKHLTTALLAKALSYVCDAMTSEQDANSAGKKVFVEVMLVLSDVWNAQQFPRKKNALDEISSFVEVVMLKSVSDVIWSAYSARRLSSHKNIYDMFQLGRFEGMLGEFLPAGEADQLSVDVLKKQLLGIEETIDGKVVRGKRAFSHMLKRNTKKNLDMIQLNGTGLGFLLGAVFCMLMSGVSYLLG